MSVDEVAKLLLNYGFPGLFCWLLWAKLVETQKALMAEKDARIADQKLRVDDVKGYTTLALNLSERVMSNVDKLTDISKNRGGQ